MLTGPPEWTALSVKRDMTSRLLLLGQYVERHGRQQHHALDDLLEVRVYAD